MTPKYPDINVNLTGLNGNDFVVLGAVSREMRSYGLSFEEINEFRRQATGGNYDHLLQTVMKWVSTS